MADIDEKKAKELVENNTRKELNLIAKEEGIERPKRFPKKMAVAKEILKNRKIKKHSKKPTGLYIED